MNWIQIAKDLPLNGNTNTKCPENCGSGEKLSVTHSAKSYWCNCYRCGFTDSEWKGKQTLAELTRVQELNKVAQEIELPLSLPADFTTDIPLHGRLWLYKGGLTESLWSKYKIGYSEKLDRVILPIYEDNKLVWYQCRALHKGQLPKYIQPAKDRSSIMFKAGWGTSRDMVVVVEDIASAIRVGEIAPTVSLLGTKITTPQASVLSEFKLVASWLDSDKAGLDGSYKIRRTLGLVTDVVNVTTELDPKELSNQTIKGKLCGNHLNRIASQ